MSNKPVAEALPGSVERSPVSQYAMKSWMLSSAVARW